MSVRAAVVVAVALCGILAAAAADDQDTQTCDFKYDAGAATIHCKVPKAKKKCCALNDAANKCMEQMKQTKKMNEKEATQCIQDAITDNGFDPEKMNDEEYMKKECPVMSGLTHQEEEKKYCKSEDTKDIKTDSSLVKTSTCSFGDEDFQCKVPGVKKICCEITKAMLPCGENKPTTVGCQTAAFQGLMNDMLAAGVDVSAADDPSYWEKFCPVLTKFLNSEKEDQTESCEDGETKLFSVKAGFSFVKHHAAGQAPASTTLAMTCLGVAFLVGLLAAVKKRLAVSSPTEVELVPAPADESAEESLLA
jgi:hypothetical protein